MEGELQLIIEEIPEKEKYKCDVCNLNFYKRYYSAAQNARALEGHLRRQSHLNNVERRKQGLEPERQYTITAVGKQLGELVERLGSRIEDLEGMLNCQTRRLESLESGSVRSWLETVPETSGKEEEEPPSVPSVSSRPPLEREKVLARFQASMPRVPQHSRDLEEYSDAYSEDTTVTDITEAEYPPSRTTPNNAGYSQSYNHSQNQRGLEPPFEEESSRFGRAMMSKSKDWKPTESEVSAVYQYDGNNYSAMVLIGNMLERLMIWIKQHYTGSKLTTNLQYIHRTQSALNVQMRQRMNGEPRDAEDTELLLDRFYSLLEHEWEA